jgi:type IV pilus assembly protein PilV
MSMRRHAYVPRLRFQRLAAETGFSLIESLVTLIILSIGVISLMALQLRTLADSRTASMRNVATVLAGNLADQIRSNEMALNAGVYKTPPVAAATATCYSAAGCTTTQMALTSFKNWLDDAAGALPEGTGTVCVDSTPNDGTGPAAAACDNVGTAYVVKVWWREGPDDPNAATAAQTSNLAVVRRFVTVVFP